MLYLNCSFSELAQQLPVIVDRIDRKLFKNSRWFQSKDAQITDIEIKESINLAREDSYILVALILEFIYIEKNPELYYFPLLIATDKEDDYWLEIAISSGKAYVYEAVHKQCYHQCLLKFLQNEQLFKTESGSEFLACQLQSLFKPEVEVLSENSSNSLSLITEKRVMKTYRHLQKGENPDLEIPLALQEKTDFDNFPHLAGYFLYRDHEHNQYSLSLLIEYITGNKSGWDYTRDFLEGYVGLKFTRAQMTAHEANISRLGEVVAEMHHALATAFGSHPPQADEIDTWQQGIKDNLQELLNGLQGHREEEQLQQLEGEIYDMLECPAAGGKFTRIHGDLHLEQILWTGDDFYIIDFEGEPLRDVEARRRWYSPLKDIAGMLRSFAYIVEFFCRDQAGGQTEIKKRSREWCQLLEEIFLSSYFQRLERMKSGLLPPAGIRNKMLTLYRLEKAIYEGLYELKNRPDWLQIPLAGIRECVREFK